MSWIIINNKKKKAKSTNTLENNISTNIKLSKSQIAKIIHSGRFLGSFLSKLVGPSMKAVVPLVKNI